MAQIVRLGEASVGVLLREAARMPSSKSGTSCPRILRVVVGFWRHVPKSVWTVSVTRPDWLA